MYSSECQSTFWRFLAWLLLQPWSWLQYDSLTHQLTFTGLHGVISHNTELFVDTTVWTSNPTKYLRLETCYCFFNKKRVLSISLTHSWSWALLEKLSIMQLLKNFPAFYATWRFITVFTRALHWSLFWARSIQSIPSYLSQIHFNIVHLPMSWSS
jgi:hypothetical protein